MLSRLSLLEGQSLGKCLISKFQPLSAISSSAPQKAEAPAASETPAKSGQRDLVNFPRRARNEKAPPVRFGFIPDSWFQFFYPKTGVTGPYMFIGAVGTYLLSKEIIVFEHNVANGLSYIMVLIIIHNKYGDKIGEAYNKLFQAETDKLDQPQKKLIENTKLKIDYLEKNKNLKDVAVEIMNAKKDIIYLQMEAAYRQRLAEAYQKVQKRLDCLVELQNVERRVAQKNIIDYVLRNVMSSLSAEHEKVVMQNCITNLNTLAAKA